jgi:DNA-binding LacI/PurR family transcriptional regulator
MRLLRRKARGSRNKKPQPFYSIRAAASHFGVPATTVSRIYNQLKSEGLLTSVWGSKTFVEPAKIDNQLRVRGIVALPASLASFCTFREYRNFFVEMRDALWKFSFATRLLFYEGNDAQLPSFAELLLGYKPDIVIWFLPSAKMKGTAARLLDRGIRVITVADSPGDCRAHHYRVDRERAIKNALLSWQQNGIRSVTVLQDSRCGSFSSVAMVEKCLRDTAMPHAFANSESWQLQDILPAYAQPANQGIIFPSSELTVALAVRDPARFAKLLERSRILLMDGPIDVPGSYAVKPPIDVVEVDLQSVAKRIVSDLIQSTRSRSAEPVTFQAKWVPRVINHHLVTHHSVPPTHRLGESRIAV